MIERHPWGGLADPAAEGPAQVAILGVPYDGSACWRDGSAEAPRRLREISDSSPAVSEEGHFVDPRRFRVRDCGDVAPDLHTQGGSAVSAAREAYFERVAAAARQARAAGPPDGAFVLGLGGDHSVTIPLVRAFAGAADSRFGLVLLDAHPDLFDVYDDSPLSNACPMRRALETGRLAAEHLLILGTRSYNQVELDFMAERNIRFVPARELDRIGMEAAVSLAGQHLAGLERVYLTVDIDVADPAFAPGTGAPVAGGLSSRQLLDIVRGLVDTLPVKGMDLVEIAPKLDPTDATLFLGLQLVFETIAALDRKCRSAAAPAGRAG